MSKLFKKDTVELCNCLIVVKYIKKFYYQRVDSHNFSQQEKNRKKAA